MKRTLKILSIPLILALLLASLAPSLALDKRERLEIMSSVVQVWIVWEEDGDLRGAGIGSGTIVSADGLILTNHHVAFPAGVDFAYYLGIALTVRSDQPPMPAYLAEVAAADQYLDLAVLRVIQDLDGSPIDPDELNLPFIELGDSTLIDIGDDVNVFGYPGIGGDTITFTRGVVSGFSLDAAIKGRAWIKTDATIAGGNSGGTAVDEDGYLIGVPTQAGHGGVGGQDEYVDCRPLADTNGNGRLDDSDTCVPVGGFINALRPIRLAQPLIEAARLGLNYQGEPEKDEDDAPTPTGRAEVYNLFFSPGVNEFNQPTSVIDYLPSGVRSLYLFFDYENMSPDMTLEMMVEINGQEAPDWGWPAGPWGGGENGIWWIGWADTLFTDGNWQFIIYVDGKVMAEPEIEIGGRGQRNPAFSNIYLSLEEDIHGGPREPAVLFPAGIKTLYAFFDYENMSSNLDWNRTWYIDGQAGLTKDETWGTDQSGTYSLELTSGSGLEPGAYRLALYIAGDLAAMSNFWVTGDSGGGAFFEPIVFAEGEDRRGNPIGAADSFPSGQEELHAFSDYGGMEDGLDVVVNWYVNAQKVIESPYEWDSGAEGTWHDWLYSSSGPLPDGEYGLELVVEEQVLQSGTTTVGTGAPPPDPTPQPKNGVQIEGDISDLNTGRAIAGAVFLVLQPGITVQSFEWTDDEIYTFAETDRNGYYKLPLLLERGECYSMIMAAENYWSYGENDVCISQSADEVIHLPIQLEHK